MVLRYLLDEHLRGPLRRAIQWHNSRGSYPLDVVRVGDFADLGLGTTDPAILVWAEREERILVSHNRNSLARHLADHLRPGPPVPRNLHHSPPQSPTGSCFVSRGSCLRQRSLGMAGPRGVYPVMQNFSFSSLVNRNEGTLGACFLETAHRQRTIRRPTGNSAK